MLQKNNRIKILEIFFQNPLPETGGYQLREISRNTQIAPPSVKSYLEEFIKEKLIKKKIIRKNPIYNANMDNEYFKLLKKLHTIQTLNEIRLINNIYEICLPETIILFGSASKGEDLITSDIDLFIQCEKTKINLEEYEQKLKRKINLFFSLKFDKLSNELKNNIVNGYILQGYLKAY